MHLGIPVLAALAVGALFCPSANAQFGFGVDMRQGPNGSLTDVDPDPNSTFTVWDCIAFGFVAGTVELQYDPNADFNVALNFNWTDTASEVVTNGCGLFPVCPVPSVDPCGPQVTQRTDYGRIDGALSLYCNAAGGGIAGGATYTRIADGTIAWDDPLEITTSTPLDLRLPIHIGGSVLGAESFGNPNGTWGKAELTVQGTVFGQSFNRSISVESVSTIPEQASIDETIEVYLSVPAGTSIHGASVTGHVHVETRAESAGFYGTIVGAATASADLPDGIGIGRITLADGSPLPPDVLVRGRASDNLYEGGVGEAWKYCQSSPNSTGSEARIDSIGAPRISQNDFHLVASGVPPSQPGLFLYGSTQKEVLFGSGYLCVGGGGGIGITRLNPPVVSDASGSVLRQIDFSVAPAGSGPAQIEPGSTWNFQYWYRDPLGGGSGFNLSDGLAVTFVP